MAEKTGIQWTDHTFNIAWGCTKVSPGCANCYADRESHRYGFDVWGPGKERRIFGEKHWNEPLKWNRDAEKEGRRHRVFCSSMCDVFEDHPTIGMERLKLARLVVETPWLDWQILTKRAGLLKALAPIMFACEPHSARNVWLGVSVEDQMTADERIPLLLATPAAMRFVSYEPALGPVDFECYPSTGCPTGWLDETPKLDWVIVGGESGPGARPCDIAWIQKTAQDCKAAGVPVFVKQLGAHVTMKVDAPNASRWDPVRKSFVDGEIRMLLKDRKGGDPAEWLKDLRVREFPEVARA